MFQGFTVGKKISMGFSITLLIMLILGAVAVIQMTSIKNKAGYLANDYIPEVNSATEIERGARATMYEARGFAFTEKKEFAEKAKQNLKTLKEEIDRAKVLAEKSIKLVKLKSELPEIEKNVLEYEKLFNKTVEMMDDGVKNRTEMATAATEYFKNIKDFLRVQTERQNQEFSQTIGASKNKERADKIAELNRLIEHGFTARMFVWKAIAQRQNEAYKDAEKELQSSIELINKIRPQVHDPVNLKSLDEIQKSANLYLKGLKEMIEINDELEKTRIEREKVSASVLEKAELLASAAVKISTTVSDEASFTATSSNIIILVGLIVAVALGVFLSIVIVRGIVGPLSSAIDRVGQASHEITTASEELSTASQTLAEASNEQASSIEETSASLEELSGMVKNNVASAEKSSELAEQVKNVSSKGATAVKDLVHSMDEILASNGKIQDLVKVIAEIGDKTAIIDEIVFQTKLLSFNASVEAERAGEHGRGFAVVAQEVGNLAQMSGKAALEISTIVKESITNAEQITKENRKKVEEGNELVKATAAILEEIESNVKIVATSSSQIVEASKDQASGINQINSAMVQLDKATQNNASTSEETASSSEELSAQAITLNDIVSELLFMITGNRTNQGAARISAGSVVKKNVAKGKAKESKTSSKIEREDRKEGAKEETKSLFSAAPKGDQDWESL